MNDWLALRSEHPVTTHWAFLDHAAVAPLPAATVCALNDYAKVVSENGIAAVKHGFERIQTCRRLAADLIHAPAVDDVYFVPSTTYGIGVIAEGFPWKLGDNVVLAAEEYPSNQYPWMNLTQRGVEVRTVPSRGSRLLLDDIRAALNERTRVLTVSAVEFSSGFRNDLDALGELCRSRDVFFFVDAIQALGAFPVDVQRSGIDALAADGHKWMLGPEGAGIGYIRRDWVERLHPIGIGTNSMANPWNFSGIDFELKSHAGRWEGGAYNVPGISALCASLHLLSTIGLQQIEMRVRALTDFVCERAPAHGWQVFSSREPNEKSGIVSLIKTGVPPDLIQRKCRDAGIIVNNRANRVRVSPHYYNTDEELDRFLRIAVE